MLEAWSTYYRTATLGFGPIDGPADETLMPLISGRLEEQSAVARPDPFRAIPPDILTTKQLAERLGYSEVAVRSWIDAGIVPGRKLGPEWRFWWPSVVIALFWNGEDDERDADRPLGEGPPPAPAA